jgi:hypothetical protein
MVMAMKTLLLVAFLVFLLAFGSCCLFFPRYVQAFASRAVNMGVTAKCSALKAYVESNSYLVSVRAIGVLTFAMCVILAIGLYG